MSHRRWNKSQRAWLLFESWNFRSNVTRQRKRRWEFSDWLRGTFATRIWQPSDYYTSHLYDRIWNTVFKHGHRALEGILTVWKKSNGVPPNLSKASRICAMKSDCDDWALLLW